MNRRKTDFSMNYLLYEPEDFATDAFFCRWVLEPTPENETFWLDWLHSNPAKKGDIEIARKLVLLASSDDGVSPSPETIDRIWQAIEDGKQSETFFYKNRRLWMKVAASVALLVLAFSGYLYKRAQNHTYRTAFGESRRLLMPDGSQVTLNANSSLRISDHWGQSEEREVWLEGEAFFQVSKIRKKEQPVKFVVHTHDLNVEVKGTQFNVNTRKNQTQVVLSEGLVHLYLNGNNPGKEIRMKPGDLVDFSASNQKLSIQHLPDASAAFSWKNNRWMLNDTSLEDIAELIQETYGVTVIIGGDSLRQQKVTGIVPTDNFEDLLGSLESILPITITRRENEITIENR
jgi:transmembrane sensor